MNLLHLHSLLEYNHWLVVEQTKGRVLVESQVQLLPVSETIEIANEMGIKPPQLSGRVPCMTTDLVLHIQDGDEYVRRAFSCKYAKDLLRPRVRDLLKIEEVYWSRRDVICVSKTELDLSDAHLTNLRLIRRFRQADSLLPGQMELRDQLSATLRTSLCENPGHLIHDVCEAVDSTFAIPVGTSMACFWWSIAQGRWRVDVTRTLGPLARADHMRWLA